MCFIKTSTEGGMKMEAGDLFHQTRSFCVDDGFYHCSRCALSTQFVVSKKMSDGLNVVSKARVRSAQRRRRSIEERMSWRSLSSYITRRRPLARKR